MIERYRKALFRFRTVFPTDASATKFTGQVSDVKPLKDQDSKIYQGTALKNPVAGTNINGIIKWAIFISPFDISGSGPEPGNSRMGEPPTLRFLIFAGGLI